MKTYFKILGLIALWALSACEKNEVLPDHAYEGTSTATLATISVSNDAPVAGEEVTITLYYVNMAEDPASQLQLLQQIGDGDFSEVTSFDESSAPVNEEITRTFSYTVPAELDSGTAVTFDMLLSSQKDFPQRERTSLEVTTATEGE